MLLQIKSIKQTDLMKAAIYIRVSTAEQNIDLQKDGLVEYAQRAGFEIIQEYVDMAVSGRKEGRPQLRRLMKAARNREFDCVLVWKNEKIIFLIMVLLFL